MNSYLELHRAHISLLGMDLHDINDNDNINKNDYNNNSKYNNNSNYNNTNK